VGSGSHIRRYLVISGVAACAILFVLGISAESQSHPQGTQSKHLSDSSAKLAHLEVSNIDFQSTKSKPGGYLQDVKGNPLKTHFTRHGAEITTSQGEVNFVLSEIDYGSTRKIISATTPSITGNRVTYKRAGIADWFVRHTDGLEQGFRIDKRPRGVKTGLTLRITLSGSLHPELASGSDLIFTHHGTQVLKYSDLKVTDNSNRILPAHFRLVGKQLLITIDDTHAQYPLTVDPYVQNVRLAAPHGIANDHFGSSTAVSSDGKTVIVGAPGVNHHTGVVYIFTQPSSGWLNMTQVAVLKASNAAAGDNFGQSVATFGNTIVVGAPGSRRGKGHGQAYVFTKPTKGWARTLTQSGVLINSTGQPGDGFGWSISMSGTGVVVGAPFTSISGKKDQGASYIFTEGKTSWVGSIPQTAILTASAGSSGDLFGYSVGACGCGETLAAGAPGSSSSMGAIYIFHASANGWSDSHEITRLTSSNGRPGDRLGTAVAMRDGVVVAGAPFASPSGRKNAGAAYVFTEDAGGWVNPHQTNRFVSPKNTAGARFGSSVAISDQYIGIGSPGSQNGQGSLYELVESGNSWGNHPSFTTLTATDGLPDNALGQSVGISDYNIVGGAANANVHGKSHQGLGYVFGWRQPNSFVCQKTPHYVVGTSHATVTANYINSGASRSISKVVNTASAGVKITILTYRGHSISCRYTVN
jgi:trimeric autotransporter adhesin